MKGQNSISVFEHERLTTSHSKFSKRHLNALLKLNEYHGHIYFDAIPDGVKFNQHVGIIQIDGLTIEIHPKADKNDDNKKWKGVLLQMLKACGKLKASTAGAANVNRQNLNLLEVYFELFLSEVSQLIRQGLVKKYRKETNNVKALKGAIHFAGNIQQNIVHKERFYTKHQVYDNDHLLHQVLYRALEILEQFCKGTYLYDSCKRVMLDFPEVKQISVGKQQLDKIVLNRKTATYSYSLEIARLIILNYSPDISSGNEKMLSLLFDMNKLWEEFILVQLRKELEGTNYEATGQATRPFLGSNYLQPDIVIQNKYNKEEVYIIDTKWKLPTNDAASIADLRQMYAYGRFWDAAKVMLLYPGVRTNKSFRSFKTDDYILTSDGHKEIDHQCKLGFVSVLDESGLNLDADIGRKVLNEMEIKKNILQVLGEGGSITLSKQGNHFYFKSDEGALLDMLDEEDRIGLEVRNKSKTYDNFESAFEGMLEKYPIFKLYPDQIHSEYLEKIKMEYLKFRLDKGELNYSSQSDWEKILKIKSI